MKRVFKLSMFPGALVVAVALTSLAPVSPQTANAQLVYRTSRGDAYYRGGYAPGDRAYSGYGYGPYGYGGYTYVAPRAYVYPVYPSYSPYGNRFRTERTYHGMFPGMRRYRPAYTPYGYGGYDPYDY